MSCRARRKKYENAYSCFRLDRNIHKIRSLYRVTQQNLIRIVIFLEDTQDIQILLSEF